VKSQRIHRFKAAAPDYAFWRCLLALAADDLL
jgi:hypothetical protein